MADRTDIVYQYDGSFDGLMCCVYDSYYRHEQPAAIFPNSRQQMMLFETRQVETDGDRAARVTRSIAEKISPEALNLIRLLYLTCMEEKESVALRFIRLGFKVGRQVMCMLAEPTINALNRAVNHMTCEAHLLTGFIRFSEHEGVLIAVIEPKNCVLPLIANHFADRFSGETFMIYDKTNALALIHEHGRAQIVSLETFEPPAPGEDERAYRALWQRFYDTIAIEGRKNPKCCMTHMPKRYWPHMTEFQEHEAGHPAK